jgi:hypothetical protein
MWKAAASVLLLASAIACSDPDQARANEAMARIRNQDRGGVRLLNLSKLPASAFVGSQQVASGVVHMQASGFMLAKAGENTVRLTVGDQQEQELPVTVGKDVGLTVVVHPDGKTVSMLTGEPRKATADLNVVSFSLSAGEAEAKPGKDATFSGGSSQVKGSGLLAPGSWTAQFGNGTEEKFDVQADGAYSVIEVTDGGKSSVIVLWNGGGDKPVAGGMSAS